MTARPKPAGLLQKPTRVIWEPTDRQVLFLESDDYEVLYGGAVGGGKSDALLMDGLGLAYGAHLNPNHSAIIFRRSYPELMELIDRAREIFGQMDRIFGGKVHWNPTDHRFTFPKGGHFRFGYLANDQDRFKYKQAYNWIGFDELTLWATSVCYDYLRTRNRSSDIKLPKYMRSTTNPDGPGQKWVMERWGISQEGEGTRQTVMVPMELPDGRGDFHTVPTEIARAFIPARLSDNPHLRGTGYAETLALQDDPDVVEALLKGKWIGNRVRGAIYINQMQLARSQNRIGVVPFNPAVPVNTFWDLGLNDTTAIWFHQQDRGSNRFPLCMESSGVGLEYYAGELQRLQAERGYVYGKHYLPHDGVNRTIQGGAKRTIDLLRQLLPGHKFEIVPRTPQVITGIRQTRAAMATCVFDKVGCADGIAALDAYRFKFDQNLQVFGTEPVHDWASNYADGFRQFGQGYEGVKMVTEQAMPEWKKQALSRVRRRSSATA